MPKLAIALLSTLLVVPALAFPLSAAAAPASSSVDARAPASIRVVVDASGLGDAGAFFEDEVRNRVSAAVEAEGHTLVEAVDADVTVRVRLSFYNEADLDYQVDVDISAGAELLRLETLGCPQCVDTDLLERIEAKGGEVAAGIDKVLTKVEQATPEGPTPEGPEPGRAEVAPIGVLGGVGIGVAALGLGAVVAGAVELSRGRVYEEQESGVPKLAYVDHTQAGVILVSVGAVGVIAGTVLLVLDLKKRADQRKRGQTQAAYPLLGPGVVGLGYTARF